MPKKFVPEDFEIPGVLETDKFRLRKLTAEDVKLDFDAVSTSTNHLKNFFGLKSKWPEGLTIEEDLKDLKWHQKEFEKRSSFAYTVMNLDETKCLGCVYLYPPRKKSFEADVYYWVREDELKNNLDEELGSVVRKWVKEKWPFTKVAYPGRDISWDEWNSLK